MPLIHGAHSIARSNSKPLEIAVSEQMQDYWLAFAKDPVNGLPKLGWQGYAGRQDGESMLIGWENEVVRSIADSELESACNGGVPNGKPRPPYKCVKRSTIECIGCARYVKYSVH